MLIAAVTYTGLCMAFGWNDLAELYYLCWMKSLWGGAPLRTVQIIDGVQQCYVAVVTYI